MHRTFAAAGWGMGLVAAMALVTTGCQQDQPTRKYLEPIEGTALKINAQTNEVSMELVHPRTGTAVARTGYVNEKTRVEINGVIGRVEDIDTGDAVRVTGYFEGDDEDKRFIVTSISVRKPTNEWIVAGQADAAATSPATRAAPAPEPAPGEPAVP